MPEAGERIKTYIGKLDNLIEGGVPRGFIVLLCGQAGTMKSSLGYSILYGANKECGAKSVYLTLEQSKQSLLEHMAKLGMPPEDAEDLVVIDLARVRKETVKDKTKSEEIDWPKAIITALKNYKRAYECELIAVDSLAAMYALTSFTNPRAELFHFFEQLRELNLTAFLISEMPTDKLVYGMYGIEDFLADGIIHLKVDTEGGNANLFVGIVKMRKTSHPRVYFPLIFEEGHFEIVT
jgi:KaiC/GvpD/RAD55 family RecA-like ATPase